jgi:UDP:flavonoid glycosyltransferase YjiC (YdhE family)
MSSMAEPGGGEPVRILFVTSNGTGLGHLTRSMAIARRLPAGFESLVLTLSAAAPVVREAGFPVEYVASYATPGAGSDWRWSRRLRGRLRAAIAEARPSVLVFDGAHPYQALLDAMPAGRDMRRVWCRRPLWKPGSNPGALEREGFFHEVLEPGELAAAMDRGPTVARRPRAHVVAPIVYCDEAELLPRAEAERELGLEPGRVNVLVQLGQGEEVRGAVDRCVHHLAGREGVQVAALSSAIATLLDVPEGVAHLHSTYPISRYYRAFDAVVAAAGYNAYHEVIRFGVPALFIPMARQTDDQAARAQFAEEQGFGVAVSAPDAPELEARLDRLLDDEARAEMKARLDALPERNGAEEAARWLAELAVRERRPIQRTSPWRRYLRQPLRSARSAAPFLARLPRHGAAFVKQTLTRPQPRTVLLALGTRGEALSEGVRAALARTADSPERVLVVTDSLEFGPLRAAGVGFEHIPAQGEVEAELTGVDYDEFVRSRLALILAERRRPRLALAINGESERYRGLVRTR